MDNHLWAKEAVNYLVKKGIVNGVSTVKFSPEANVTREQFAKMAVLMTASYNQNSVSAFSDVSTDEWYSSYVASAAVAGLVNGRPDGTFGVGEYITREDIAVILMRIAELKGIKFNDGQIKISDFSSVSDYAARSVNSLNSIGIIKGNEKGEFEPKRYATRAEAAVLIYALQKECEVK